MHLFGSGRIFLKFTEFWGVSCRKALEGFGNNAVKMVKNFKQTRTQQR
jgi:hypothetical protein